MDRLELQRIILHPCVNETDLVILIGNFSIPAGLRIAEAALSRQEVHQLILQMCFALKYYFD